MKIISLFYLDWILYLQIDLIAIPENIFIDHLAQTQSTPVIGRAALNTSCFQA